MASVTALSDVAACPDGTVMTVRVNLHAMQLKRNRLGRLWATLQVVDGSTTMTLLLFPQTYASTPSGVLAPDALVEFEARVLKGENGPVLVPHGELRLVTD